MLSQKATKELLNAKLSNVASCKSASKAHNVFSGFIGFGFHADLGTNEVFVHIISASHDVFPFLSVQGALLRNLSAEYATYETDEFFSTINRTQNEYLVVFTGITNSEKESMTDILAASTFNADLASYLAASLGAPGTISASQISNFFFVIIVKNVTFYLRTNYFSKQHSIIVPIIRPNHQ